MKFGPKHKGLVLAVAIANGNVAIHTWQNPTILTSQSDRIISVVQGFGECTCLTWNPSFDEPSGLIVGCLITKSKKTLLSQI